MTINEELHNLRARGYSWGTSSTPSPSHRRDPAGHVLCCLHVNFRPWRNMSN